MRSTKIVLIVILCGFVAFLCGVLGLFLVRQEVGSGKSALLGSNESILNTYQLVLEKEIDSEGIENITVDYGMNSNDVMIYQATGEKIVVKEYLNFISDESYQSTVEQSGNSLIIRGKQRTNSVVSGITLQKNGYTEIYLPEIVFKSLIVTTLSGDAVSDLAITVDDRFSVSSTSGDIRFGNLKADTVRFESASGDIHIQGVDGNVNAVSTSGDIHVTGEQGDRIISSVSGEIFLEGVNGFFQLCTTSGDIHVRDGSGYGEVSTVSGDANISLKELTKSLSADTTSGDVICRLPEDASFSFEFNSTSGSCRTFFDDILSYNKKRDYAVGTYGDNSSVQVRVSTISGDLSITKY